MTDADTTRKAAQRLKLYPAIKERQVEIDELNADLAKLNAEQTADLIAAYRANASASYLGSLVGVTKQVMRNLLVRNGVKMRPRGGDNTSGRRTRPAVIVNIKATAASGDALRMLADHSADLTNED